jgi:hypothetical protein
MRRNGYKLSLQPHRRQGYKRAWVARFGTLQAS